MLPDVVAREHVRRWWRDQNARGGQLVRPVVHLTSEIEGEGQRAPPEGNATAWQGLFPSRWSGTMPAQHVGGRRLKVERRRAPPEGARTLVQELRGKVISGKEPAP